MNTPIEVCFGHRDEWDYCYKAYGPALDHIVAAHEGCLQMLRAATPTDDESIEIHFLARACLKEFEEILLLAGNGYGCGATKLLRSFYERVATLGYLAENQNAITDFRDYTAIHWHKLYMELKATHPDSKTLDNRSEMIIEEYQNMKSKFTESICKCGKKRVQMSWTKKPVAQLVSESTNGLRNLCFKAYLLPTFYLHTTHFGIMSQSEHSSEGAIKMFGTEVEHNHARDALMLAHLLLLYTCQTIDKYFHLKNDQPLKEFADNWSTAWKDSTSEAKPDRSNQS